MDGLSNREKEYHAAVYSAGLIDRSTAGLIEVTGADRVEFLQRMTTNDMGQLASAAVVQTVLTTPEARIVDLLDVYMRPDSLLVVTSPDNGPAIIQWFRGQIFFRDKVKVADVGNRYVYLELVGPKASMVLSAAGLDVSGLADLQGREYVLRGCLVFMVSSGDRYGKSFRLFVSGTGAGQFGEHLLDKTKDYGVLELHAEAQEMLRVASGVPALGRELREDYNALEAGLRRAISFSKGCYTGQEVIARLDAYQKLKQSLVRVIPDELPAGPLPLKVVADGIEVGNLTSVAEYAMGRVLGLGYVRAKYLGLDHGFEVMDGEHLISARVHQLGEEVGHL